MDPPEKQYIRAEFSIYLCTEDGMLSASETEACNFLISVVALYVVSYLTSNLIYYSIIMYTVFRTKRNGEFSPKISVILNY